MGTIFFLSHRDQLIEFLLLAIVAKSRISMVLHSSAARGGRGGGGGYSLSDWPVNQNAE